MITNCKECRFDGCQKYHQSCKKCNLGGSYNKNAFPITMVLLMVIIIGLSIIVLITT